MVSGFCFSCADDQCQNIKKQYSQDDCEPQDHFVDGIGWHGLVSLLSVFSLASG